MFKPGEAIQFGTIKVDDTAFTIICNTLENTKFVYFDHLPSDKTQADTTYEKVLNKIEDEAGKYYLVVPGDSGLIDYIRRTRPEQLTKITGANPLFTRITESANFMELNPTDFQVQVYINESNNSELRQISERISAFQTQSLCDIRPDLTDEVAKSKIEERYQPAVIEKKLRTNSIAIFVAKDKNDADKIIASLVITSFAKDLNPKSSQHLYASDLILKKELVTNQVFISQFMGNVYKLVPYTFPNAAVITLLAPGQTLGQCISNTTQKNGDLLCTKLVDKEQNNLGLVPYFVAPKNQPQVTQSSTPIISPLSIQSATTPISDSIKLFGIKSGTKDQQSDGQVHTPPTQQIKL